MHFERTFELPLSTDDVWKMLWDVERMVACVPGCAGATTLEEGRHYEATIVEKVGPFKVTVPLRIEVLSAEAGRGLRLRASGRDTKVGTEVSFDLNVTLHASDNQTHFQMAVDATVVGRLVSLGQAVIKLKGDQQIRRFAEALQADLAAGRVASSSGT